jgi:2-dehydro-3-deoxyphosphogluconate aldolase / (4S)-4-hydroxy-2-oxoglutarate aldolase
MEREDILIQQIQKLRILPLFYHADKTTCIETAKALYAGGVRAIEFTNRGENALENFKALVAEKKNSMPELLLGIGTIKTADAANSFIEAGPDFLISPVFDATVADAAYMNKILWIPGCMTPTEIHVAQNAGCKMVKLFPGNVLQPGFVSAVKELFPDMLFVATGGVEPTKENLSAWFKSGVAAVGMGSKLITKQLLDEKNYNGLTQQTKDLFALMTTI